MSKNLVGVYCWSISDISNLVLLTRAALLYWEPVQGPQNLSDVNFFFVQDPGSCSKKDHCSSLTFYQGQVSDLQILQITDILKKMLICDLKLTPLSMMTPDCFTVSLCVNPKSSPNYFRFVCVKLKKALGHSVVNLIKTLIERWPRNLNVPQW